MNLSAIISTVVVWLIIIIGLVLCFTRLGKGGGWND
jgi:hypothetical protein